MSPAPSASTSPSTRPPFWYTLAWTLALPLVALYLLWRSARQPEYRRHWGERFLGRAGAAPLPGEPCIWIHAVSVGETLAAQPLLDALARAHPDARFVLTHMTPTGRAAGRDLVRTWPGRVAQRYLPYDLPWAVGRFLDEERPQLGVLMETEIWPQLLHAARLRGIPMVLANARLSERSLGKALRQIRLIRAAASALQMVGAQSAADGARIARLFDGPVHITGNAKFDREPDPAQLARGRALRDRFRALFGDRPVWLFASTREGEEKILLDALQALRAAGAPAPNAVLLFVPRHPQRFDAVAALLREGGAQVLRRTQWEDTALQEDAAHSAIAGAPVVLLGDSMGEMPLYYALADVAFIGGSLLPLGGQNLIEACACACPVVLGPHMFNFAAAADDAVAAGAACRAADAPAALRAMDEITRNPAVHAAMAAAARAFAGAHRGATARTVALIDQVLAARSSG
jgi:3-deoxy-D-manno-octulosonic-acid transferase